MKCALVLADGAVFYGDAFGSTPPTVNELIEVPREDGDLSLQNLGEVVFNTAMTGYPEVLTDPSYTGQIVVMTSPQIGNYGIDSQWAESAADEDRPIKVAGFVVRDLHRGSVPPGRKSLEAYLADHRIPGITAVDTRALTLNLRDNGSRNGLICRSVAGDRLSPEELAAATRIVKGFPVMEGRSLVTAVGSREVVHLRGGGGGSGSAGAHIALYDCGIKSNIVRELQKRGCSLSLMPSTATAQEIRATGASAVLLSNGPGDPAVLTHQVEQTRELLGTIPVLGICLGHQIIAEAVGGQTFKMSFGHHGVNHPVRDERQGRVFVTSQNHGFAVREDSLPETTTVWFRNANDDTVEGLWDDTLRIRTTQFHPESAPGPHDSTWIFNAFLEVL